VCGAVEEDVLGLEVAVEDSLGVARGEGGGQLREDEARGCLREAVVLAQ